MILINIGQCFLDFQIGDQILDVNNQSFLDVTHDEAVSQLKYHKRMSLIVRDVGKVPHSCTSVEPEPWDAYSPTEPRFVYLLLTFILRLLFLPLSVFTLLILVELFIFFFSFPPF